MDGVVEEDDLRQNPADAFFSGSLLSPFWCSWRLLCVFFVLGPFTKVVPFNVLEAVASGTVAGTVGDDRTEVVKCSAKEALDDFLILIFSFLLARISSDFLSNICNKNNDKEICKYFAH